MEYNGIGWGLELIKFKNDKESQIRVGRVHRSSPAARAKLQPGDILISINGRGMAGSDWPCPFLVCAMLASPVLSTPQTSKATDALDMNLETMQILLPDGPRSGPVILKVSRQRALSPLRFQACRTLLVENAQAASGVGVAAAAYRYHHMDATEGVRATRVQPENSRGPNKRGPPAQNFTKNIPLAKYASQARAAAIDSHQKPTSHEAQQNPGCYSGTPIPVSTIDHIDDGGHTPVSLKNQQQTQDPKDGEGQDVTLGSTQLSRHQKQLNLMGPVGMPALVHLGSATLRSNDRCQPIQSSNLYVAAGLNTVLTEVEAAVFLEAVRRNCPMLGLRLLMPRYCLGTLVQQVICLNSNSEHLHKVPRISESHWKALMAFDFVRFQNEPNGPKIFEDQRFVLSMN